MTVTQAAGVKAVSPSTIWRAVREGRLPAVRVLGRIGIRPADLEAWKAGSTDKIRRDPIRRPGSGRRRKA